MGDRTRFLFGLILVVAGAIFLLDAADIVSVGRLISDWWPLLLVGIGLLTLRRRPRSWTGGLILIAIGGVLLLATTGVIDITFWQLILPLVLIGVGLGLLIRGVAGSGTADRSPRVNLVAVLGDQQIRSTATDFRQGSLTTILGEANLDLRSATLDPSGAEVDVSCILGEITIYVPRGWRVEVEGMPILGEFGDRTDRDQALPAGAPRLRINGVAILGEVNIRHG